MKPTPITGARLVLALDVLDRIRSDDPRHVERLDNPRKISIAQCRTAIESRLGTETMTVFDHEHAGGTNARLDEFFRPFVQTNADALAEAIIDIAPILEHLVDEFDVDPDTLRRFFGYFATGEITERDLQDA